MVDDPVKLNQDKVSVVDWVFLNPDKLGILWLVKTIETDAWNAFESEDWFFRLVMLVTAIMEIEHMELSF